MPSPPRQSPEMLYQAETPTSEERLFLRRGPSLRQPRQPPRCTLSPAPALCGDACAVMRPRATRPSPRAPSAPPRRRAAPSPTAQSQETSQYPASALPHRWCRRTPRHPALATDPALYRLDALNSRPPAAAPRRWATARPRSRRGPWRTCWRPTSSRSRTRRRSATASSASAPCGRSRRRRCAAWLAWCGSVGLTVLEAGDGSLLGRPNRMCVGMHAGIRSRARGRVLCCPALPRRRRTAGASASMGSSRRVGWSDGRGGHCRVPLWRSVDCRVAVSVWYCLIRSPQSLHLTRASGGICRSV